MATQLETYVPLKEAARKYGIPAKVLTRLIEDGDGDFPGNGSTRAKRIYRIPSLALQSR
jgi:hypothetical protein